MSSRSFSRSPLSSGSMPLSIARPTIRPRVRSQRSPRRRQVRVGVIDADELVLEQQDDRRRRAHRSSRLPRCRRVPSLRRRRRRRCRDLAGVIADDLHVELPRRSRSSPRSLFLLDTSAVPEPRRAARRLRRFGRRPPSESDSHDDPAPSETEATTLHGDDLRTSWRYRLIRQSPRRHLQNGREHVRLGLASVTSVLGWLPEDLTARDRLHRPP